MKIIMALNHFVYGIRHFSVRITYRTVSFFLLNIFIQEFCIFRYKILKYNIPLQRHLLVNFYFLHLIVCDTNSKLNYFYYNII